MKSGKEAIMTWHDDGQDQSGLGGDGQNWEMVGRYIRQDLLADWM